MPAIPAAWVEQVQPGGVILTDWRAAIGGTVVRLRRDDDGGASGRRWPVAG